MPIKILIVDDHKIIRDGLSALINKQPDLTIVGETDNGRTAVELAVELSPDVIIMDVIMPVMTGIDATREIIAQAPGVKVIGLSMHSDKWYISGMLEAGASGYLLKDNISEELIEAIRTVVNGGIYLSSRLGVIGYKSKPQ
jgi:two-component system response regulator NreC